MRLFALVVVVVATVATGCATTPHGQAVQQTAAGAVLLPTAIGGTIGTIAGAAVLANTYPTLIPDYAIPGVVGGGVVTVALYVTSILLLRSGAATLDAEAAVASAPTTARATAAAPVRKRPKSLDAVFEACVDTLCFEREGECEAFKREEFLEVDDQREWLRASGCME